MDAVGQYFFVFITIYSNLIELEAVTVSTFLCATNKISPRQRQTSSSFSLQDDGTGQDSWKIRSPRTLDQIYNLLGPSRPQRQLDLLSDLQGQPQEYDRDDCGARQGFGKKDLSSVTQNGRTKDLERQDRKYTVYNNPPYKSGPNIPPNTSQRPLTPTGPSNNLKANNKPVWEIISEHPQADYTPDLIGGPLAYIVGFSSRRPTTKDPPTEGPLTEEPLTEDLPLKESSAPIQFPENNSNNKTRQKKSQEGKSISIIRSFVDLLFN